MKQEKIGVCVCVWVMGALLNLLLLCTILLYSTSVIPALYNVFNSKKKNKNQN